MKNNWSGRCFVLIYQFQVKTDDTNEFIKKVKLSDFELNTYKLNSDKVTRLSKECNVNASSDIRKNNEEISAEQIGAELVVFESGIGFAVEHFQLIELDNKTLTLDNIRKLASIERVKNTCKELENCDFFPEHSDKPIVFTCLTWKELNIYNPAMHKDNDDYAYFEMDTINNLIGKRTEHSRLVWREHSKYYYRNFQQFAWDATAQGCCIFYNGEFDRNYRENGWSAAVDLMFNTYVYTLHQMFYYERLRLLCKNTNQYKIRQFLNL